MRWGLGVESHGEDGALVLLSLGMESQWRRPHACSCPASKETESNNRFLFLFFTPKSQKENTVAVFFKVCYSFQIFF